MSVKRFEEMRPALNHAPCFHMGANAMSSSDGSGPAFDVSTETWFDCVL